MDTNSLSTKSLVFGILSIALSESVILSLVFSILAIKNANKVAAAGAVNGKSKAGKILGIVGLVCAIIALVIIVIAIVAYAAARLAANA